MRVLVGHNIGYTYNFFLNGGLNIFSNSVFYAKKEFFKNVFFFTPAEITARKHAR